jgi:hypothetical protein
MKQYEAPIVEIIYVDATDVITSSDPIETGIE